MELQFFQKRQTLVHMLISLNFTSFSPWTHHTLWIRNLVRSALRVCLIDKLPSEINTIKGFALWDDFPKSVVNSIINKTLNTPSITEDFHDVNKTSNEVVIYFYIHHSDGKGCPLIKSCIHKLNKIANKNDQFAFRVLHDVTKIDVFCSNKDKTPTSNQSLLFEFVCSGCNANYVGKTLRIFFEKSVAYA